MKTRIFRLPAVLILPAALLLSQCVPTPTPTPTKDTAPRTATAVAVPSQHWVKVSSHPPTFYPRGVAADCPTDCQSGEWIHTGDKQDTRYFIPVRGCGGVPRQTLVNEALAARSDKKVRQIAASDRVDHVCSVLLTPVWPFVWPMCGDVGIP